MSGTNQITCVHGTCVAKGVIHLLYGDACIDSGNVDAGYTGGSYCSLRHLLFDLADPDAQRDVAENLTGDRGHV